MLLDTALGDLLRALERLNDQSAWEFAVNQAVLDEIQRLIIEDQLSIGIDGLGDLLGDYKPFSVKVRNEFGLQTDYIDLNFTEEFYDSITAYLTRDYIGIDGEGQKPDQNLFEVFGEDIVALTDENMSFIIDQIRDGYLAYVHQTLGIN